jgi:hypothetical protein
MTRSLRPLLVAAALSLVADTAHGQTEIRARNPAIVAGGVVTVRIDSGALRRSAAIVARQRASAIAPQASPQATGQVTAPTAVQGTRSATISRARLQQVLGHSAELRVVRASGVTDLAASAASVTVAPGEFIFRKMSDTARRIAREAAPVQSAPSHGGTETPPSPAPGSTPTPSSLPSSLPSSAAAYAMPYRWMTVDSAGVERVLMPYFVILGGGLTYDVATRMYRGLALVGVEDTLHQSADPVTLIRPLRLQLATMSGGKITPAQIAIAHTSLDYDSVRIESPDSTFVRIRTGADPAGIVIPIPVLGLAVAMTPQQQTLQGFGLATTDIGVSLPRGMARTDTAIVNFSATGSPVRPATVRVSGAEGATVRVRSGQPGANTITAFIDGVQVGHTEVVSEPPISFLVATLLGILLGGAARFVGGKRRKRLRSLPYDIMKGAPFGLLAAIAGAVGLDLAQLKLGEPGALPAIMVTAAIGAWFGAKILDRVGPSTASTSAAT